MPTPKASPESEQLLTQVKEVIRKGKPAKKAFSPDHNPISTSSLIPYAVLSTIIKIALSKYFGQNLQIYPHFSSNLSSISNVKEAIFSYENNGVYYAEPNGVNQSLLVIKLLQVIMKIPFGLEVFFLALDLLCCWQQIQIANQVWRRKANVSSSEIKTILAVVFLNPIQFTCLSSQNLGQLGNLMSYITINMYISGETRQEVRIFIAGLNMYIDPNSWVQQLGFFIMQKINFSIVFEIAGSFLFTVILMVLTGDVSEQLRNTKNILLIADHEENIGFFFYIAIETFILHIFFFLCAYIIYSFVILLNIRQLVIQQQDVIDIVTSYDKAKREDRHFRLRCVASFLVMFVKIVFNQYPVLYDYNLLLFIVICMNKRVVAKYAEGTVMLMFMMGYSVSMTFYMWVQWLQSFQGNANFFYFQTIVFNTANILFMIQMFQAVSTKTYKYDQQLQDILEISKEKDEKKTN